MPYNLYYKGNLIKSKIPMFVANAEIAIIVGKPTDSRITLEEADAHGFILDVVKG